MSSWDSSPKKNEKDVLKIVYNERQWGPKHTKKLFKIFYFMFHRRKSHSLKQHKGEQMMMEF